MIVNTEGIILKNMKQGDSSRIITAFCRETGLIKGLAKGSRSSKNKSLIVTDLLSINSITYYQKKSGDLHKVTKSERTISTSRITDSYIHTNIAVMIIEALLQSLHPEVPQSDLFDKTVEILKNLNELPEHPFMLFIYHQIILAGEMGFEPDLSNIPNCDCIYNIETGNWHENYDDIFANGFKFKQKDAELLSKLNNIDISDILAQCRAISSDKKLRFIEFFTRFFSFHLEKKFKYTVY